MRSLITGAVAALLVLGLAACSSGSSSTAAAPSGGYGAQPGAPSTAAAVPRGPASIGSVSRTGAPLGAAAAPAAPAVAMPMGGRVSNDPRITNHLGRQLPAGGGGQWVRPMGNQAPRAIFYVFAFPG